MKYSVKVVLCNDGAILVPEGTRYGTYFGFVPNAAEYRLIEWESKEPVRVADYFVPIPQSEMLDYKKSWFPMVLKYQSTRSCKANDIYYRDTFTIGQQPEGSVMVPGSEREVTE